jgi:hypothetical protein
MLRIAAGGAARKAGLTSGRVVQPRYVYTVNVLHGSRSVGRHLYSRHCVRMRLAMRRGEGGCGRAVRRESRGFWCTGTVRRGHALDCKCLPHSLQDSLRVGVLGGD